VDGDDKHASLPPCAIVCVGETFRRIRRRRKTAIEFQICFFFAPKMRRRLLAERHLSDRHLADLMFGRRSYGPIIWSSVILLTVNWSKVNSSTVNWSTVNCFIVNSHSVNCHLVKSYLATEN